MSYSSCSFPTAGVQKVGVPTPLSSATATATPKIVSLQERANQCVERFINEEHPSTKTTIGIWSHSIALHLFVSKPQVRKDIHKTDETGKTLILSVLDYYLENGLRRCPSKESRVLEIQMQDVVKTLLENGADPTGQFLRGKEILKGSEIIAWLPAGNRVRKAVEEHLAEKAAAAM